jgi:ribulose-phosphate 3-epimerase
MVEIIPAILAITEDDFGHDLEKIDSCESFEDGWIHIDFIDNKFVQNQTITPDVFKKYQTNLKKEAHLMVVNPSQWLDDLYDTGFKRVIAHIEVGEIELRNFFTKAKDLGLEVGLAINPETSIDEIEKYKEQVTEVLVMSVEPGLQGQKFIDASLNRVDALVDKNITVAVDGGIGEDTIKRVIEAGATRVVIGSYLLKGDIDENMERLWEILHS